MHNLKPVANQPDHLTTYVIRVETGNQEGAGTDASITMTLTGKAAVQIFWKWHQVSIH